MAQRFRSTGLNDLDATATTTGWSEYWSAEHARPYWHNSATGETTWERPLDDPALQPMAADLSRVREIVVGESPAPLETDLSRVREVVVGESPAPLETDLSRVRDIVVGESPAPQPKVADLSRVREIVVGESPEAELEREVAQRKAAQAERAAAARAEWSEYWAEEYGLPYWHNSRTGETTYDRPEGLAPTRAAAAAAPAPVAPTAIATPIATPPASRASPPQATSRGAAAKQVEGYPDLIWPAPAPTRQPEIVASGAAPAAKGGSAKREKRIASKAARRRAREAEAAVAAASPAAAAATVAAKWWPLGGELAVAPPMLDGALPGDAGFDPLGLAKTDFLLGEFAEAEVKHARLAMLCAAGWPLGEMWHGPLRRLVGSDINLAGPGGRAPAVLNGGLGGLAGDFCFAVMIALAFDELAMMGRRKPWKRSDPDANLPGDRGLDPFGNYAAASPDEKFALRTQEIKNGRTAMMAVLFYAVFEATTGTPIVQQFAPLFRPFWETPGLLFFGAKYTP